MGLMNASVQFQQMIDDRIQPVNDVADAYIDDILVGTCVEEGEDLFEAHDRDLRRVLSLLEKEQLIVDVSKCKLFVPEVEVCGHVLGRGVRKPAPGKLMAIEKWEVPKTISELRAFLGFTNYYSTYIHEYAKIVACLQDKLKVSRADGKKGSKVKITWTPEDQTAFDEVRQRLCSKLVLQRVNPNKPFVLRVDATKYAVGATLEQLEGEDRMPTANDVKEKKTVPVAFMSRKLTPGQRNWVPREQETYAIILALQKWESWIGLQPVLVLTDHKALEHWAKEIFDTPSGPIGIRLRWHQMFSKYDLSVWYVPGKYNTICDILSRWAYPASQAFREVNKHGTLEEKLQMEEIIRQEKEEEATCMWIRVAEPPLELHDWIRGVGISPSNIRPLEGIPQPAAPLSFSFKKPLRPQSTFDEMKKGPHEVGKRGEAPSPRVGTGTPHLPTEEKVEKEENTQEEDLEEESVEEGGVMTPSRHAPPSFEEDDENQLGAEIEEEEENDRDIEEEEEDEEEEEENSAPPSDEPEIKDESDHNLLSEESWGDMYSACPHWSEFWVATKSQSQEWPKGLKILNGRMFIDEKMCIPLMLQNLWVRECHEEMGHVGPEKLWETLRLRYAWANKKKLFDFVLEVMAQCDSCQACQRPRTTKTPLVFTPIPPKTMSSVALDIFHMSKTRWNKKEYDAMAICVDRHSGWMVVVPCLRKGLTGAKLAQKMLQCQWAPFGIPQVITSDQGPQFVSAWFETLAALLGIRHAFSHAYHHQANGRAEMAGQQILEKLRKLHADQGINWVEALPTVLRQVHDTPGESGLSPYQILFGRDRCLPNVPYESPKDCEDAQNFFKSMKEVDQKVANILNEKHRDRAEKINAGRSKPHTYNASDKVWYRRPENSGDKLDSRWLGPATIEERIGENSYEVRLNDDKVIRAHVSCIKPYVWDKFSGNPKPMYFHQRTVPDPDAAPDEWRVEKILDHRWKNGKWEFLVKWEGFGEQEAGWEPANSFFHRYNSDVIDYASRNDLDLNVTKFLSKVPMTTT
jgi:hypothetical protein